MMIDASTDMVDCDLRQAFLESLPGHVFQLVRYCKIKATSNRKGRLVTLLAPDRHFAQTLLNQPELAVVANQLDADLRVCCPR